MTDPNPQQVVSGQPVQPIQAPLFTATFFQTFGNSNEISVFMANNNPGLTSDGKITAINQAVMMLSLSPQSAKDLSILLNDAITNYERTYGEIVTDFTMNRAQQNK